VGKARIFYGKTFFVGKPFPKGFPTPFPKGFKKGEGVGVFKATHRIAELFFGP
jgi:hypothetical protein